MSKFNQYARKADQIAKAAFEEYRKAEAAYKKAEEQARQYPQRGGMVNAEYAAKSARAHADLIDAKEALRRAQTAFTGHNKEFADIRKELVAAVNEEYSANPDMLDASTLELLKSGILKPSEYTRLMNKAQAENNYTMARMISKYAGDAAAERGNKYGQNDEQARTLRAISYTANRMNGNEYIQNFDYMAEAYKRTANNPAMIDSWGELTSRTVEEF